MRRADAKWQPFLQKLRRPKHVKHLPKLWRQTGTRRYVLRELRDEGVSSLMNLFI
jgi:hypothetical protein